MRPASWKTVETVPLLHSLYRYYRRLPDSVRSPIRVFATPLWSSVVKLVLLQSQERVVSGPFRGLALNLAPVSRRHLLSYVLGTTELELQPVLERIIARRYRSILNVGAADGYYAVGLASRSPTTQVTAYEAKEELHPALARIARLNGVEEQIAVHGICDAQLLSGKLGRESTLILMDIEGAERAILDPATLPGLRWTDILVETHDVYAPGCTDILIKRFSATHDIERFTARPRVLSDFPPNFLSFIPKFFPNLALDLMDERRAGTQEWLFMIARDHGEPRQAIVG